jgi:phosphoglycolate phosphatase
MKINAILFDLDGTLVDTAPDIAYTLNFLLKANNLKEKPYKEIKPIISNGLKEIIKFGFEIDENNPNFDELCKKALVIYEKNITKNSKVFDGINYILQIINQQNKLWGIVTNKSENLTRLLLKKLKLKPNVLVCGDTLKFKKPSPEPLLYACKILDTLPQNCIFIGDDKIDILAGKNANIKTIAVSYGYGKVTKNWGYDYLINNSKELEKWIL